MARRGFFGRARLEEVQPTPDEEEVGVGRVDRETPIGREKTHGERLRRINIATQLPMRAEYRFAGTLEVDAGRRWIELLGGGETAAGIGEKELHGPAVLHGPFDRDQIQLPFHQLQIPQLLVAGHRGTRFSPPSFENRRGISIMVDQVSRLGVAAQSEIMVGKRHRWIQRQAMAQLGARLAQGREGVAVDEDFELGTQLPGVAEVAVLVGEVWFELDRSAVGGHRPFETGARIVARVHLHNRLRFVGVAEVVVRGREVGHEIHRTLEHGQRTLQPRCRVAPAFRLELGALEQYQPAVGEHRCLRRVELDRARKAVRRGIEAVGGILTMRLLVLGPLPVHEAGVRVRGKGRPDTDAFAVRLCRLLERTHRVETGRQFVLRDQVLGGAEIEPGNHRVGIDGDGSLARRDGTAKQRSRILPLAPRVGACEAIDHTQVDRRLRVLRRELGRPFGQPRRLLQRGGWIPAVMKLEVPAHPVQLRPEIGGPRISRSGDVGSIGRFQRLGEEILAQRPVLLLEVEEPDQSRRLAPVEIGVAPPDLERPGIDLTGRKVIGTGGLDLSVFLQILPPRHQDFSLQAHGLVTPRVAFIRTPRLLQRVLEPTLEQRQHGAVVKFGLLGDHMATAQEIEGRLPKSLVELLLPCRPELGISDSFRRVGRLEIHLAERVTEGAGELRRSIA